ncbi:MAG: hypothetical protein A3F09_01035 [Chlamydiae bacterium RIFCSPHIGHO2_12_FULL_49_11]|nr:MAG: hypothetical protein A3F09_01035 [Chlamydiae bacterium RIFCSPHIGHO2_12_FULL_49_11]
MFALTKSLKTLTATFLIAGTCIGGGILALPIEAGEMGFFPALFALLVCSLFMAGTGLLYAQASLWVEDEQAHVVSISKHLLGRTGEWCAVVIYLFMGYASLVAYNSQGVMYVQSFFQSVFAVPLLHWQAAAIFAAVFGSVLFLSTQLLGVINALVFGAMIVFYFLMVSLGAPRVNMGLLTTYSFTSTYKIIPLVITSFSMQMIVPSISIYLGRDAKALKFAVSMGILIPAFLYAIWIAIVLGIVPHMGDFGTQKIGSGAVTLTAALEHYTSSRLFGVFSEFFGIFALVTSYFGIGLGLYDFMSDLTKVHKRGMGKILLVLIVVIPTLYFTVSYPGIFLLALDLTGGFGDSTLDGIIPVLMVWMGTRVLGYSNAAFPFVSRPPVLGLLFLSSLVILTIQIIKLVM